MKRKGVFVKSFWSIFFLVAGFLNAEAIFKSGFETGEPSLLDISNFESLNLPERGNVIVASVRKDGKLYSTGIIPEVLPAGWYVMEAKYKTEGIHPMGGFNLNILTGDYKTNVGGENVPASSVWSRIRVVFYMSNNEKVALLLHRIREAQSDAKILLDDIALSPLVISSGENMLSNPTFSEGKQGELPSNWNWDYHGPEENYKISRGDDGDYGLVADNTFQTRTQVMRVIVKPDQNRELRSFSVPLPETGSLEYSIWAKGEGENLSLRLAVIGAGYKYHLYKSFSLTDQWRQYKGEGNCKPLGKGQTCWLRIDFSGSGKIFITDASLIWKEEEKSNSQSSVSQEWWGTVGRNLLLNPGFELGWTGWLLDYFVNQKIYKELYDEPCRIIKQGKNDFAFCLTSKNYLLSTCFPIVQGKQYSLSADLKSTGQPGKVYMFVTDPGWNMYGQEIENIPSDKWTRYTFTFIWDKPSKSNRAMVRFTNRTEFPVLIDNVQFEEGEPTEYTPPPVMIGLMAMDNSRNVFLRGEQTPQFSLRVIPSLISAPEKIKVQIICKDAWERVVLQKELFVSGCEESNIPMEFPGKKLGVFEIRLKAFDQTGHLLGSGISRYAVIEKPDIEVSGLNSFFGVGYNIPRWTFPAIKEHTEWMRNKLGVGINRFFLNNEYYPVVVKYEDMERIRRQLDIQREAGIELIGVIGIPNELRDKIVYTDNPTPEALNEFAQHVRTLVMAFKNQIRYWEVLNEPNIWRFTSGPRAGEPTMPPSKNIKLHEVVYKEVKKIDPSLKVVGICVDYLDLKYLKEMLELGVVRYMDVFSFHGYRLSPDLPEMYQDIIQAKELLKQYGFKGPIINDEQAFLSNNFAFRTADLPSTEGVDYIYPGSKELLVAALNIRNLIQCAAAGVPLCLYDPPYILGREGGTGDFFMFYLFGAYNAANRFLSGAVSGEKIIIGKYIKCFLFSQCKDGPLVVIYTPEEGLSGYINIAGDWIAYDMMGNPLDKEEILKGLPIRTDPIYVRFPRGTPISRIKEVLSTASITGLGSPFKADINFSGAKTISVFLTNMLNNTLSGSVSLVKYPDGWVPKESKIKFSNVLPGQTVHIDFDFINLPVKNLGRYPITVGIESNNVWSTVDKVISPFFARYLKEIDVDSELSEWTNAEWIDLNEAHLSTNFNPSLKYQGPDDLSARIACGWNEEFFALAVVVNDDVDLPPESPAVAYLNDSIQIYFDPLKNGKPKGGYDSDDIVYSICNVNGKPIAYLEKGTAGHYVGAQNQMVGVDGDVSVSIKRKEEKRQTIYEVKLPKYVLPNVNLQERASFRFSLLINDNDGKGRKVGLTTSPPGSEPYKNPGEYPDIILVK